MDIKVVIVQIIVLFAIIGIGVYMTKKGMITPEGSKSLTKVVLNVGVPGMVISSVLGSAERVENGLVISVMLFSFMSFVVYGLGVVAFKKAFGFKGSKGGVYAFMILFGNTGFMGFPIVRAIFGNDGMFFASIVVIPTFILSFSLGIMLIIKEAGGDKKLNVIDKLIHNPPFLASTGALIWYLLKLPTPNIVLQATTMVGDMCSPLSMIIIGSSLASVAAGDVFKDFKLYVMCALRLLILPLLYYFVLYQFNLEPIVLGVLVIIAAMPVAANGPMFCVEYNGDSALAAKGVFLSTALCVITIPLLTVLLFNA